MHARPELARPPGRILGQGHALGFVVMPDHPAHQDAAAGHAGVFHDVVHEVFARHAVCVQELGELRADDHGAARVEAESGDGLTDPLEHRPQILGHHREVAGVRPGDADRAVVPVETVVDVHGLPGRFLLVLGDAHAGAALVAKHGHIFAARLYPGDVHQHETHRVSYGRVAAAVRAEEGGAGRQIQVSANRAVDHEERRPGGDTARVGFQPHVRIGQGLDRGDQHRHVDG